MVHVHLHVPAKFWGNTAMHLRVKSAKIWRTDRLTDEGRFNISHPVPSVWQEIISDIIKKQIDWYMHVQNYIDVKCSSNCSAKLKIPNYHFVRSAIMPPSWSHTTMLLISGIFISYWQIHTAFFAGNHFTLQSQWSVITRNSSVRSFSCHPILVVMASSVIAGEAIWWMLKCASSGLWYCKTLCCWKSCAYLHNVLTMGNFILMYVLLAANSC